MNLYQLLLFVNLVIAIFYVCNFHLLMNLYQLLLFVNFHQNLVMNQYHFHQNLVFEIGNIVVWVMVVNLIMTMHLDSMHLQMLFFVCFVVVLVVVVIVVFLLSFLVVVFLLLPFSVSLCPIVSLLHHSNILEDMHNLQQDFYLVEQPFCMYHQ